jgi:hypothetical protein
MTTKTKTTQINAPTTQIQNTTQSTQAQNTPTQNTPQRRVITISSSRDAVRGRPSAKPNRDYIIAKLREMLDGVEIDLGDYSVVKLLQVYISTYTANYVQGLILTLAMHKEQPMGILANLAFRCSIANNDLKVSVKNAIRVYEPLLTNLTKLVESLDPVYVFK